MSLPATALIADDEPHLARALAAELSRLWPELQLSSPARNGVEAAERLGLEEPDIAFLDIQMPGLTGLEVAQGIEGDTLVVFVTAYDAFAVQAFEQAAVDYVLKPVSTVRLQQTVQRLQRALQDRRDRGGAEPADSRLATALKTAASGQARLPGHPAAPTAPAMRWIRASAGDMTHQVPVDEVLYFQADEKYTCVVTAQAEHLIRTPIAELAQRLDPERFWQVHRSTIVNLAHLAGTRRDDNSRLFVRIRGQARELPVSRAYVHLFKAM
jgi:DNA-binding LytR/AlgR family response regulator